MYWVISAALLLAAGFICAFGICEWIVRGRATSLCDRLRPYESDLLPYDTIPWQRPRVERRHQDADLELPSGTQPAPTRREAAY
jgi:hypothetical protein